MFAHLDDPEPYVPPAGMRAAVVDRVRRRRRRRVAVAGGVATVAALGLGSVAAVRTRLEPQRIEVGGLADEPGADVLEADAGAPGEPVTILVVGTDARWPVGIEPDGAGGAELAPAHADSIGLVRLDPGAGEVRLLTVPRDLVVTVDGEEMRAGEALPTGGPSDLIRALDQTLGTPIHHYVQVDLNGARDLVDALDGIRVAVDRPVRDDTTGLALDAGCHTLDGTTAVALGRARTVEVRDGAGAWIPDPGSAVSREARGAAVAAALLQAAGRVGFDDLPDLIRTGLSAVTVDADLGTGDLERWARHARDGRFVALGLPVTADVLRGGDVLRVEPAAAGPVLEAFAAGASAPIPAVADGTPVVDPTGLRPC